MTRPTSTNFFLDNDDLRFQLSRVDWPTLVALQEAAFADEDGFKDPAEARAFYEDVLTNLGEFIAKEIAAHEHELDAQHPVLKDGEVVPAARMKKILDQMQALGALSLTLPRRLGGSNVPILVQNILVEMITRADASVAAEFGFYSGIGQALLFYSMEEGSVEMKDGVPVKTRFDDVVRRIAENQEWGAMVLTEPGAGSDLAQIKAKAVLAADGNWRLTGQKIFITAGHGDHHIVIARSEDDKAHPGLKGLSLFYVPRFVDAQGKRCKKTDAGARKNFELGGVEHKMGQHSAVAATINYDESHAELLGQRGHGFLGMLMLMNNARISVGFEGIGTCEAAWRMARAYADERVTMGKPIAHHEMIADYLDEMEVVIRGLRAITFDAAYHEEVSARLKVMGKLKPAPEAEQAEADKKIRRHKRKARALTPLIKYWAGEECVRQARMCMQIMGGIGYITETGAEKILRDALVIPVYEGTSQIQALMALKDNLQAAIRNPTRFLSELATARLETLSARSDLEKGEARLRHHAMSAMQTIITRIAADKLGDVRGRPLAEWKSAFMKDWNPQKDFSFGLLHAERLTKLLTWSAVAETLVRQSNDVKGSADYEERASLALRFIERFEPRARGVVAEIEATGGSLIGRVLARPKRERGAAKAAE
ncbi:MAG: acyl-CoA dehydrogenase family protein [Deltaproteobacteria bacterium]|nr:acyl-CoA dehydrogenase family protein [Deltaproteobacteria bacterium]